MRPFKAHEMPSGEVPTCALKFRPWQLLWMELFFWINFIATCASLAESCIVLGLAYNTEEYLYNLFIPPWLISSYTDLKRRLKLYDSEYGAAKKYDEKGDADEDDDLESAAGAVLRQLAINERNSQSDDSPKKLSRGALLSLEVTPRRAPPRTP